MIKLEQAIVVEGKYDKIKLKSLFDTAVVTTEGFGIFSDKKKQEQIKLYARTKGIIILTDSDGAGFVIRNFIKNICKGLKLYNAYIPDIYGKEKRKIQPSAEHKIGVEGIEADCLIHCIQAAVPVQQAQENIVPVTMADLYELGLTGQANSEYKRKQLLAALSLPEHMTSKAFLEVINLAFARDDFFRLIENEVER